MKRYLAYPLLVALALAAPVRAEEAPDRFADGMEQLSEGTRLLLEGLMGELAPMVNDLRGMIDDLSLYEMPEVLPNGDIIIRRKRAPDAPPVPEGLPPREEGEIDI